MANAEEREEKEKKSTYDSQNRSDDGADMRMRRGRFGGSGEGWLFSVGWAVNVWESLIVYRSSFDDVEGLVRPRSSYKKCVSLPLSLHIMGRKLTIQD